MSQLMTEAPIPTTYPEMWCWITATGIVLGLTILCYTKIRNKTWRFLSTAILAILTAFLALISWMAYIEASGQMIQ